MNCSFFLLLQKCGHTALQSECQCPCYCFCLFLMSNAKANSNEFLIDMAINFWIELNWIEFYSQLTGCWQCASTGGAWTSKALRIRCLPQQHFKKVVKIGKPILWSVEDLLHFLCHIWASAPRNGLGFLSNVFTNPVESSFSLYVCIISIFHKLN